MSLKITTTRQWVSKIGFYSNVDFSSFADVILFHCLNTINALKNLFLSKSNDRKLYFYILTEPYCAY